MRLSELLSEELFEKSFSEILKFVPETKKQSSLFYEMFRYLKALPAIVKVRTIVMADSHFYLEDEIYYVRLHIYPMNHHYLKDFPLLAEIVEPIYLCVYFKEKEPSISKEKVLAGLLWNLVGLNNLNIQTTPSLQNNDKIIESICEVTPYNISPDKGAYRIECTLDDYMWHEEKRTIIFLYYSNGYEAGLEKITRFIHEMMRNPTIVLGKSVIKGIVMKCLFIS